MREILTLEGGVAVTPYIKSGGYKWTRNTLHSSETTRTKDGTARVVKITDKLTLDVELGSTPVDRMRAINDVMKKQTFQARFYSLDGMKELTFYCSSFSTSAMVVTEEAEIWNGASFTMIEV